MRWSGCPPLRGARGRWPGRARIGAADSLEGREPRPAVRWWCVLRAGPTFTELQPTSAGPTEALFPFIAFCSSIHPKRSTERRRSLRSSAKVPWPQYAHSYLEHRCRVHLKARVVLTPP